MLLWKLKEVMNFSSMAKTVAMAVNAAVNQDRTETVAKDVRVL